MTAKIFLNNRSPYKGYWGYTFTTDAGEPFCGMCLVTGKKPEHAIAALERIAARHGAKLKWEIQE